MKKRKAILKDTKCSVCHRTIKKGDMYYIDDIYFPHMDGYMKGHICCECSLHEKVEKMGGDK